MNRDPLRKPTTPRGWRDASWEARKLRGVPLDLPSGVTVKVVRPRFELWFGTAKMPEVLAKNVVKVFGKIDIDSMEEEMNQLTEEENNDILRFMNDVIMAAVVEPRIVDKPESECDPDKEFSLAEVPEEDRAWIMLFVFEEGVPEQPVPTTGGEVSMAALKSDNTDEPSTDPGPGMREVQTSSK
jgi:hypothetical protein